MGPDSVRKLSALASIWMEEDIPVKLSKAKNSRSAELFTVEDMTKPKQAIGTTVSSVVTDMELSDEGKNFIKITD